MNPGLGASRLRCQPFVSISLLNRPDRMRLANWASQPAFGSHPVSASQGRPQWPVYAAPTRAPPPPSLRDLRRRHRTRLATEASQCDLEVRWLPAAFEADAAAGPVLHVIDPGRFLADAAAGGASGSPLTPSLPPLAAHPAASSVVARKMLHRLTSDLEWLEKSMPAPPPTLRGGGTRGGGEDVGAWLRMATDLVEQLGELVTASSTEVENEVSRLTAHASEGGESALEVERLARALGIAAGAEPRVPLEMLCELLTSSDGQEARTHRLRAEMT